MRNALAEKLLAKIMEWPPSQIDIERPLLQALADFKFNDYQQFSPGTRFIESLVKWLEQFQTNEDKNTAYRLVKEHLVFISNEQIAHLVNILFSEKINPILINKSAKEKNIKTYLVTKILDSEEYKSNLRMSLFLGLSDGSRIDQFRRSANLNNEQVSATYEVSDEKIEDMLKDLRAVHSNAKFKSLFLIDDFTASGRSYFRPEQGKGKIIKFFKKYLFDTSASVGFPSIIDYENLDIHILFYIATSNAISMLENGIKEWQETNEKKFKFSVDCLLVIDEEIKSKIIADAFIMKLLEKYFDSSIVDKHYKQGKHDKPFLGFNECGLPLVLCHNTPNNSLPLLWLPEDKKFVGLFPRISRHKDI